MEKDTRSQPLSAQLADRLAAAILSGETYRPGQRLPTERELSETLGASRTSIREASKQLEARGLLEIRRGVGTFITANPGVVRDPLGLNSKADTVGDTVAILSDWYRVRMILEGEAMQLVADNASAAELENIRELMEEEASLANIVDADFMDADRDFHCALSKATHNIIMERLIPSLHAEVYYDMVKGLYSRLRPRFNKNAIENHASIVEFLMLRDGQGACLAMRYHMQVAIADVLSLAESE